MLICCIYCCHSSPLLIIIDISTAAKSESALPNRHWFVVIDVTPHWRYCIHAVKVNVELVAHYDFVFSANIYRATSDLIIRSAHTTSTRIIYADTECVQLLLLLSTALILETTTITFHHRYRHGNRRISSRGKYENWNAWAEDTPHALCFSLCVCVCVFPELRDKVLKSTEADANKTCGFQFFFIYAQAFDNVCLCSHDSRADDDTASSEPQQSLIVVD